MYALEMTHVHELHKEISAVAHIKVQHQFCGPLPGRGCRKLLMRATGPAFKVLGACKTGYPKGPSTLGFRV